jgi:putative ABC transport system permease protein
MPGVVDAAMMTVFPNNPGLFDTYRREGDAPSHAHFVRVNMIDEHFLHTFKMHLLSGRNFRTGAPSAHVPVIINETTVREFQLTDPIGQRFDGSPPLEVVGVVKDFHVDSLHYPISPVFLIQESGDNETLTLRINAGSRRADTLQVLRQLWERTVPGEEFSYYWGEDFIAAQYADDEKLAKLLGVFCLLALLVASLGVFGLAAHTAEVRTKEVGIRKALGASSISIMGMLSGEMVRWVLLANLLAWPLAWYAISRWLRNFAYRTAIGFGPLVIAGLLTLAVAWLTMGFHTLRAARANPVDSLRYE